MQHIEANTDSQSTSLPLGRNRPILKLEYTNERILILLIAIAVVFLSVHIGSRALWDPDEGRYAEMGREVLVLNDWVTPHLNYLLYFEKPMMFPWMEAISQKIFGINEAATRIPPLMCALGILALVWRFAFREWGRRAGLTATVVLLTCAEFFALANAVDINMPFTFFVTASLTFFWMGHSLNRTWLHYVAWISAGLAVLTKGPIGFIIPAITILIYIIATRQFDLIIKVKPLSGLLVFLVVTVPWYALVCHRNPDFFNFFFINQNLMRYTSKIHHRYQPFWYFIPVLIGGFLPWTFLAPSIVSQIKREHISKPVLFAIIWFCVTFLVFVPSQSKLMTYILPSFMPLALLTGYAFKEADHKAGLSFYSGCCVFLLLGLALLFLPALISSGVLASTRHLDRMSIIASSGRLVGLTLISGTLVATLAAKKIGAIPGYAVLGLALMLPLLCFAGDLDSNQSTKAVLKHLPANARLCSFGKYRQSTSFYAERPTYLVGTMDELDFGQAHPNRLTLSQEEFFRDMNTGSDLFCITEAKHLDELLKYAPNVQILAEHGSLILVSGNKSLPRQVEFNQSIKNYRPILLKTEKFRQSGVVLEKS